MLKAYWFYDSDTEMGTSFIELKNGNYARLFLDNDVSDPVGNGGLVGADWSPRTGWRYGCWAKKEEWEYQPPLWILSGKEFGEKMSKGEWGELVIITTPPILFKINGYYDLDDLFRKTKENVENVLKRKEVIE